MEQRRDLGMKQISFAGGGEEVERKRRCLESSREEKRASVDGGWRMVDGGWWMVGPSLQVLGMMDLRGKGRPE